MNYEIESKLREKVDKHEFFSLQQEVGSLKNKNQQLGLRIKEYESRLQNHYSAIDTLRKIMINSDKFEDNADELHSMMNYM